MFQRVVPRTRTRSAFSILELIYHGIVREVRKTHRNAFMSLLMSMMQTAIFVAAFYFMFSILGLKDSALRGDFLLFLMSGIFLFLTHNKALSAVLGSDGPTSEMMKHAPMNTIISIASSTLGSLYVQLISASVILFIYHVAVKPVVIEQPIAVVGMFLLAWFSGVAVGMVFLAARPWLPSVVQIVASVYQRANMIASGKMVLANTLPSTMLAMFDWNPLFHCIDQSRGFTFINYNPHFSSITYPLYLSFALIMVGLMGEFVTRRTVSVSRGMGT